jgi:hypothetical protein
MIVEFDKWGVEFVKLIIEFDKCKIAFGKLVVSLDNLIEQSQEWDCQYGQSAGQVGNTIGILHISYNSFRLRV